MGASRRDLVRYLNDVFLRSGADGLSVNWFESPSSTPRRASNSITIAVSPIIVGPQTTWGRLRKRAGGDERSGYPPKPGHCVTSITYGTDLMALSRQG